MIKYVLITPARNESKYIQKTLDSVISQTIKPIQWIIIDDGSTDNTVEIVRSYSKDHEFIHLYSVNGHEERNFGSKAKAVNFGYTLVKDLDFQYVGNLDADMSFPLDYYEKILGIMEERPRLGLAGGMRFDFQDGEFVFTSNTPNSVGGPYQLFRRECFEQIEGYQVLPYGGIDTVAEVGARMFGWEVESFPEHNLYHHRPTGGANQSALKTAFIGGMRDYTVGYHFLFDIGRAIDRRKTKPYGIWSLTLLCGYVWAWITRTQRPISTEMVKFIQQEQLSRLKKMLSKS